MTAAEILAQYPEALDNIMHDVLVLDRNFPGSEIQRFAQHYPEHAHICGLVEYIRQDPEMAQNLLTLKITDWKEAAR